MIQPIVLISLLAATAFSFDKTYTIKGTATCFGQAVANAPVNLKYFDHVHKGEVLESVRTDDKGQFTLTSTKDTNDFESNDFKVYLEISSACDKQKRDGCDVLTAINIPSSKEGQVYEISSLKLERRSTIMNTCDETDDGY